MFNEEIALKKDENWNQTCFYIFKNKKLKMKQTNLSNEIHISPYSILLKDRQKKNIGTLKSTEWTEALQKQVSNIFCQAINAQMINPDLNLSVPLLQLLSMNVIPSWIWNCISSTLV